MVLLELMEVVVTTGAGRAKLQTNRHQLTSTRPVRLLYVMHYMQTPLLHKQITISIKNLYSAYSQRVSTALRRRVYINIEQKKYVLRQRLKVSMDNG